MDKNSSSEIAERDSEEILRKLKEILNCLENPKFILKENVFKQPRKL